MTNSLLDIYLNRKEPMATPAIDVFQAFSYIFLYKLNT